MVIHFEPSEFRLYHPINIGSGVYQVSGILFAAPLFETVKDYESSGLSQASAANGTHQRQVRNYGRVA